MSPKKSMSSSDVALWWRMAIELGLAKNDAELAALLGVTRQTLYKMRREGADRRTDLACRATLLGTGLWSEYVETKLKNQAA